MSSKRFTKNAFFRFGVICIIPGLIMGSIYVGSMFYLPLKNWLILHMGGVKVYKRIPIAALFLATVGLILILTVVVPAFKTWRRERQSFKESQDLARQRSMIVTNYADDSDNPVLAQKRLRQLQHEKPQFADIIANCINQLKTMDYIQDKQLLLIKSNGTHSRHLKDVPEILNRLESRMCREFRGVVNLCEVYDDVKALDKQQVHDILDKNAKILDVAQELLDASLKSINNRINGIDDDSEATAEDLIALLINYSEEG